MWIAATSVCEVEADACHSFRTDETACTEMGCKWISGPGVEVTPGGFPEKCLGPQEDKGGIVTPVGVGLLALLSFVVIAM